jgi:hypothetical protein
LRLPLRTVVQEPTQAEPVPAHKARVTQWWTTTFGCLGGESEGARVAPSPGGDAIHWANSGLPEASLICAVQTFSTEVVTEAGIGT